MDPKTANLDPKLKEAYDRIMGTNVPLPTQKTDIKVTSTAKPTETPMPETPKMQVSEVAPEPLNVPTTQTFSPPPLPPAQPLATSNEMVQSPVFNASKNIPVKEQTLVNGNLMQNTIANKETPKKKNKLKSILVGFLGILFFFIYGIVWAKVFSLF